MILFLSYLFPCISAALKYSVQVVLIWIVYQIKLIENLIPHFVIKSATDFKITYVQTEITYTSYLVMYFLLVV